MKHFKSFLDRLLAVLLILLTFPLMFILSIAIKLTSKGPVLFKQERAGLHGKPFTIYKFRTMIVNAEKMGDGYYTGENDLS